MGASGTRPNNRICNPEKSFEFDRPRQVIALTQRSRTIANGARHIKKGRSLLCERAPIKYGFIREQQKTFPVTVLCKVMPVSTSAFYAWTKAPDETDKKGQQKQLETKAIQLFDENKQVYGSRRLSEAFIKEDIQVGRFKARQLIKKLGLKPRYPKRFKVTTDSDHKDAISPNHLNRQFDVAAPSDRGSQYASQEYRGHLGIVVKATAGIIHQQSDFCEA